MFRTEYEYGFMQYPIINAYHEWFIPIDKVLIWLKCPDFYFNKLHPPYCLWNFLKQISGLSPAQDLADTAMADPQLTGDVTGPNALMSHVHNALPDDLRERASIYKHAA